MAKLDLVVTAKDKASGVLGAIDKKAGGLGKTLGKVLKVGALGAAAGIGALGFIGFKAVQAAAEQERVEKQLAATLKSTGGAAGLTAKEIKDMAAGLQKVTTFGDEATISGQNILLTFKNIGKDTFPRATEAMLDVSTAMGQDMKSSAIQLGKALNDPKAGLAALSRVGITFTDAQKKQIVAMQEAGDVAGAQAVMLKELESQFGGSARAAAETFGGRMKQLQNVMGDLLEVIGFAILPIITKLAMALTSFLLDHQKDIERFAKLIVKGLGGAFKWLGETVIPIIRGFAEIFGAGLTGDVRKAQGAFLKLPKPLWDIAKVVFKLGSWTRRELIPAIKKFGTTVINLARDVAVFLAPALDTLADLWKNAISPALAFVIPLLKKVGKFIFEHKPLLIAVAAAILLLVAPWLAVVAAIAVVLAKWDEISAFFTGLGKDIEAFVDNVIKKVEEFPIIGEIFKDTIRTAKIYIEAQLKLVKLIFETALETIKNTFAFWKAVFTGDWNAAWNAVKAQFKVIVDLLAGIFGIALDLVKGMLASKWEMVKGIGGDLGNLIVDAAKAIWDKLKTKFSEAVNAVGAWITGAIGTIKGWGSSIGNAILGALGAALDIPGIMWGMIGDFWTWIGQKGEQLTAIGKSIGQWIWNAIKGAMGSLGDLLPNLNPTGVSLGLGIAGFQHGGFVPPGVVMPAILHGGSQGEDVVPRGRGGAGGVNIYGNITVVTSDPEDFLRQLRRYAAT